MTPHFSDKELACSCCGVNGMNSEFMDKLESLRVMLDEPIILSSAYRCPNHNNEVSSTGFNGPHTTGLAVDIKCKGMQAHRILGLAMMLGFYGIGISQKGNHESRFIHVDLMRGAMRPWLWSY